jgi:Polypeptide deformylase/Protein of unknown function (DUF2905)
VRTYVNPQILWASTDMIRHEEGSVSMPGVTEEIERHARVRISYQDLSGLEMVEEADGLHKRLATERRARHCTSRWAWRSGTSAVTINVADINLPGLILVAVGLLWRWSGPLRLGRLPGDIVVEHVHS